MHHQMILLFNFTLRKCFHFYKKFIQSYIFEYIIIIKKNKKLTKTNRIGIFLIIRKLKKIIKFG